MEDRATSNSWEKSQEEVPANHREQPLNGTDHPGLAKPKEIVGIKPVRPQAKADAHSKRPKIRPLVAPRKNQHDGKWCILFIDDEEMVARMGNRTLTKLGYEVIVATAAKDAIEIFKNDPAKFDIVITDQTMPAMTGTALAEQLLKLSPNLPIILTTGYSEKSIQEQTKDLAIRAFVRKPIEISSLSAIIHNILMDSQSMDHAVATI